MVHLRVGGGHKWQRSKQRSNLMEATSLVDRARLIYEITAAVQDQVIEDASFEDAHPQITEETVLFGATGLLDSLGLVATIVNIEQRVEAAFHVSIVIADDRAMSQARSPFRTVGGLADYVMLLIEEHRQ
jgi:acyl carrier protein